MDFNSNLNISKISKLDEISNASAAFRDDISKKDLNGFSPDLSFQINFNNNNEDSINILLTDLKDSLNNELSESVVKLTQCYLCLSSAINPTKCPKCNNFACKKCFEKYLGDNTKKCPICKKNIKKKDLKKSKIIKEIEKIIYTDDPKDNKIKKLSKLIEEEKKIWENQKHMCSDMLDRILKYQENLREYRKEYEIFFLKWKDIIDKTFDDYEFKVKKIVDYFLKYNQKYNNDLKNSIVKYHELKEKPVNKIEDKDINSLVNEIIYMDRSHFNEKKKEGNEVENKLNLIIKKFKLLLLTPISIIPNISNYSVSSLDIKKEILDEGRIKNKAYNVHVGDYEINYYFEPDKYTGLCTFDFKNNKSAVYIITLKKIVESKYCEIIPMKLINRINHYEAIVNLNELKYDKNLIIKMETKIQIFCLIYNN